MAAPAFVDTAYAAEMLRVPQDVILAWVREGRLKAYGGRPDNPFVRTPEVTALVEELGVDTEEEAPRRSKSPSAKVRTRLTSDSRWTDVTESDVREWASRADSATRQAAQRVAEQARERLEWVLRAVRDE